jgi:hypothetical protein
MYKWALFRNYEMELDVASSPVRFFDSRLEFSISKQ